MTNRLFFWLLCAFSLSFTHAQAQPQRPPNIIVILADDLGIADLALYDGWIKTPRIEQMAGEGLRFTDFHANSSVCSPTRTAFLTGRYQQRAGIVDVIIGDREPDQGLDASTPTIARVFKDGGYATALFGKWHCGYMDKFNPVNNGFDEFVGFLNGGSDYHRHGGWRVGLEKQDVPGYSTQLITDRSIDFIRRNKDNPFFLYVAHQAVHNPYQTAEDTPDKRNKDENQNARSPANQERYKVMLQDLDKGVGQIIDTINELKLAENTLIIFWSDNGDVSMTPQQRPYRGGKFSHYEGGHRVPAVAWWPGKIKAGSTSDALVVGFDLFPTLADIAGLSKRTPDNLDGLNVKDHLLHQAKLPERDIFFGYEPKLGTAMRRGNWKMIVKEDDVQLYDLSTDIKETTNIADQHPQITESMRQAIETFKKTVTQGS